jgi:hypothetical protein
VVSCRLASIGAAGVAEHFAAADVDLSVLPHLNEHDLEVSATRSSRLQEARVQPQQHLLDVCVVPDAGVASQYAAATSSIPVASLIVFSA